MICVGDLEPAQRDRFLGLGRHDEVEHGLLRLGAGGLLARLAGPRDHLRGQPQRVGHLAVGAPHDFGQVVRCDRVARRAPDELLDPRLGVRHGAQGPDELSRVGDLPDGPDRDLDLLAVGGRDVHQLFIVVGPVPDLEGLGQPHDLLNQRQLEIQARLGAAGDGLAELEEDRQLALVDRVEHRLGQRDGQHEGHPDHDCDDLAAVHRLVSPFASRFRSGKSCLRSLSMIVLFFTP